MLNLASGLCERRSFLDLCPSTTEIALVGGLPGSGAEMDWRPGRERRSAPAQRCVSACERIGPPAQVHPRSTAYHPPKHARGALRICLRNDRGALAQVHPRSADAQHCVAIRSSAPAQHFLPYDTSSNAPRSIACRRRPTSACHFASSREIPRPPRLQLKSAKLLSPSFRTFSILRAQFPRPSLVRE